jgi:CheY-like chemotaxis protein
VVLTVEDEVFMRCSLADCCRDAGYVVMEAANAKHAISVCDDGMPVLILITGIQLNDRLGRS